MGGARRRRIVTDPMAPSGRALVTPKMQRAMYRALTKNREYYSALYDKKPQPGPAPLPLPMEAETTVMDYTPSSEREIETTQPFAWFQVGSQATGATGFTVKSSPMDQWPDGSYEKTIASENIGGPGRTSASDPLAFPSDCVKFSG